MTRRALELGVISDDAYEARMKDIGLKRWKVKEPGSLTFPESPSLLWQKYQDLRDIHEDADELLLKGPGLSAEFIRQITARAPRKPGTGEIRPSAS